MPCEDVEIELSELPKTYSAELTEHLKGCASCQQTARVLGLATLPEPSALERATLTQLPLKTHLAWRAKEARRFSVQRVAGYALAAGLGALVASASFLSFQKPEPLVGGAPVQQTVAQPAAPVALADSDWDTTDDGLAAADDEAAFFDVSWPSLPEGEEQ